MTDQPETKDLSDALTANYLLVSVVVRMWSAKATDQEAGEELSVSKGANAKAYKAIKDLLINNDKEFEATRAAYTKIRTFFYANTIPWGGSRSDGLIGVGDAMKFMAEFATLKIEAEKVREKLVDLFDTQRPAFMASLQTQFGSAFDPSDYPLGGEIRSKWGATLSLRPMPAVSDFSRVNVPAALVRGLQGMYTKQAATYVDTAVQDVRDRIVKAIERMHVQLSKVAASEKTRLYESMLSNLDGLCSLATTLGPVDADLEAMAKRIKTELLAHEIEAYKGNASLSRSVAEKAATILGTLACDSAAAPEPPLLTDLVPPLPIEAIGLSGAAIATTPGVTTIKDPRLAPDYKEEQLELPDIEDLI